MRVMAAALILVAAFSANGAAKATDKVHRVAVLMISDAPAFRNGVERGLADRGYALGRNLVLESRNADGEVARLPALASDLANRGAEVIVTLGYPAAAAARSATTAMPLVVAGAGDPVATGLAASLARPGGNITGISDVAAELSGKRLQLLESAIPQMKRVAMLWNADDLGMTLRYRATEAAAKTLGIAVQPLGVREPDDFDAAFAAMTRDRPDGIFMVTDNLTVLNRKRLIEFAATHRIPSIFEAARFAHDGGLMSYGPDAKEIMTRLVDLVVRILKGAKPADLPFEQPTRFKFVVNLKTAKALGLALPPSLVARADEVIE